MTRSTRLVAVLSVLFTAGPAHADGPHIAFHSIEGPYSVTIFSAPDPLVAGPVQLVLLVQRDADGALVRNAAARGTMHLAGQAMVPVAFRPGGGANPGLPGATVRLPAAGIWNMELHLAAGNGAEQEFAVVLPVAVNHGSRNTVLWAVFLLGAAILLFLANQQGKAKLRARRGRL